MLAGTVPPEIPRIAGENAVRRDDAVRRSGANDLFIAAHARSLGMTLVTNNTREFERVRNLAIENWMIGR